MCESNGAEPCRGQCERVDLRVEADLLQAQIEEVLVHAAQGLDLWILDEAGNPARARSVMEWALWNAVGDVQVKVDRIRRVVISTVFLRSVLPGNAEQPPLFFETMVFGGEYDQHCDCYSTRADALVGHDATVAMVQWSESVLGRLFRLSGWIGRALRLTS